MALYLFHERSDGLVIDVNLRNLVHDTEKLLLAYLVRRRQRAVYEFLLYRFLHLTHLVLLPAVYDGDRRAFLSRTSCSSRAVGVRFRIVGHAVVYDMRKVVNVKSSRRHVGRHKQLYGVLAELLHRLVALRL